MVNDFLLGSTIGGLMSACLISGLVMFCVFTVSCAAGGGETGSTGQPVSAGAGRGGGMRVLWNVSSFHVGEGAEWGEKEARAMLLKPLDMTSSTITFDGRTCRDVVFSRETVVAEAWFQEKFTVASQALGLEDETVQVMKTDCRIPGFSEYIRLQDNRLIVPMHGILFVFQPAVTY